MFGVFYTLISGSAEGQGLAAGGILLFNALLGLILGVLSGVLAIVKMKYVATSNLNKLVAIFNLVCITIMVFIIKSKR